MENLILESKKFEDLMYSLYEGSTAQITKTFTDVMKDNCSRLDFINDLFLSYKRNDLSPSCRNAFEDAIDFIVGYLNGAYNKSMAIPDNFAKDRNECRIIPSQEDMSFLLDLITFNVRMYKNIYKDQEYIIDLPKNTFNMNMSRIITIKEDKVAHLLGLTDSSLSEKTEHKNLLKEHFKNTVGDISKYGETDAIALLNWIVSDEGKKEMLRLNKLLLDFVKMDKEDHPSSYDENGNIKNIEKFQKEFDNYYKDQGIKYPMIRFSKILVKCINNLNFLNLYNVNSCIVDYNSRYLPQKLGDRMERKPKTKEDVDEKDLFLVSVPPELLTNLTEDYIDDVLSFKKKLNNYKKGNINTDKEVEEMFEKMGIDKGKAAYLNIAQTSKYIQGNDILPEEYEYLNVEKQIREYFASKYEMEIHLIGFDSYGKEDIDGKPITSSLKEKMVHKTHCDTSIGVSIGTLIDTYYERGRAFFFDKIKDPNGENLRISNPSEEIQFRKEMLLMGNNDVSILNKLESKFEVLNKRYSRYLKNRQARDKKPQRINDNIIEPAYEYLNEHLNDDFDKEKYYGIIKAIAYNYTYYRHALIKYENAILSKQITEKSFEKFFVSMIFESIVKIMYKNYVNKQKEKNEKYISFEEYVSMVTKNNPKKR